ncbi:mycothiol synthase [uncultured Corynebacterium sp.]|uniref:mycothiol synthase n=1 Tax=uncultured Corynebacterium sp. TaxID=159447 RepID=UPI0025ECB255|nr:mycothiol synthase [uncultured Corynebacterium sp.]
MIDGAGEAGVDPARTRDLLDAVTAADGVEPFGEAFLRGLDDPDAGHRHVHALEGDRLVGVAAVADDAVELAVDADRRRRGAGRALLDAVDDLAGTRLPVWAHGNVDGASELATATGRRVVRELLQMTAGPDVIRELSDDEEAPDGIRVESLVRARARLGDEAVDDAWLAVNNEAFDWHPEQGGWDADRLRRAREVEWFDPEGVLFAVEENTGEILGFHWTKRHGGGDASNGGDEGDGSGEGPGEVGEVYVIGLASAARGRGIGGWLTREGMRHLRDGGSDRVILYVEGDNSPAVNTYRRTGFDVTRRDVMYGM